MLPSNFYPQAAAVRFLSPTGPAFLSQLGGHLAANVGCPSSCLRDSDARGSSPHWSLGFPQVMQHPRAPAGAACVNEFRSTLLPRFPVPNAISVVLRPCRLPGDSRAVFWGRGVFVQHMGVNGPPALHLASCFFSAL